MPEETKSRGTVIYTCEGCGKELTVAATITSCGTLPSGKRFMDIGTRPIRPVVCPYCGKEFN